MKETDLYPPVKAFLEAQGYAVKGEVRGCDVVARRGEDPPVIVELKTAFGLPLILQGVARQKLTDAVYLAFPAGGAGAVWRRNRREVTALCRRLGLGLLLIHPPKMDAPPLVEPVIDPGPYQPRKNAKRVQLLLREFERRKGDPSPGGSTRQPIMTAYRQSALACARVIAASESATATPRAIREATGVENAGPILQKDHYGWFQRVERGVYGLSEKGRQALALFPD